MKQLVAKGDNIILKPVEIEEHTYGNIIVPDLGKERPELGRVVSVGTGRISEYGYKIKPSCQVGDLLFVPKIGTIRIDFEGEEYYVVKDREILAYVLETNN